MILTLTPELESALHREAKREGTTPEGLVLQLLQQSLFPYVSNHAQKSSMNQQQRSLAAIQRGKYVRSVQPNTPFASDMFAAQKQAEKELEERRWKT